MVLELPGRRPADHLSPVTKTAGDRLRSVCRFLAGRTLVRSLVRAHSPSSRTVAFSRQRQSVAFPTYTGHVLQDNNFYSMSSESSAAPCAATCSRVAGLQICDTCKSTINWYFGNLSRYVTELMLHSQPIGSFLVRNSSSRCGNFALSVRVEEDEQRPTGIAHYLLIKSSKSRVQIKVTTYYKQQHKSPTHTYTPTLFFSGISLRLRLRAEPFVALFAEPGAAALQTASGHNRQRPPVLSQRAQAQSHGYFDTKLILFYLLFTPHS